MQLRRWTIAIVSCLLLTIGLGAYKALQIRSAIEFAKSFPEQSATIEASYARKTLWAPNVNALGEVVALNSLDLRNELDGKIVELGFAAGARVEKGQLLLQLNIKEELAQLRASKAEAELAQLAVDRLEKLIDRNVSSKDQYDRAKAELAVATARAQALQASIEKKTLLAPFDAHTGLHQLQVGQYLASNTLITRLVGISADLWIDFNLPQQQATLEIGTKVKAIPLKRSEKPIEGVVIASDATVTEQSRNVQFRALFSNVAQTLRPGSIVDVVIPVGSPQPVTLLPATAVRRDSYGSNVYVIEAVEEGAETKLRAYKRPVVVGREDAQEIIIVSGLQPGEQVATNGSAKLRDGMLVHIGAAKAHTAGNSHE